MLLGPAIGLIQGDTRSLGLGCGSYGEGIGSSDCVVVHWA